MFKVICIDAQNQDDDGTPFVSENDIYKVIGEWDLGYALEGLDRGIDENGNTCGFLKQRFIILSNIDETELIKEREEQLIKI